MTVPPSFPPESEPLVPPPYIPQPDPLACIVDGVIHPAGVHDPAGPGTFYIDGAPCTPFVPEVTVPARTVISGTLPATGTFDAAAIAAGGGLFLAVGIALVLGARYRKAVAS